MTTLNPSYDPGTLKQYTSLPGEIYDADSHCRHIVGPGSLFCRVGSYVLNNREKEIESV